MRSFETTGGELIQLSAREREVLRLAARGYANKEIAAQLDITEGTVKQYLCALFAVLRFENRTAAALWCICHPEALEGALVPIEPRIPAVLLPRGPAPSVPAYDDGLPLAA